MAFIFNKIVAQMIITNKKYQKNHLQVLYTLDLKQPELFKKYYVVTTKHIDDLFEFKLNENAAMSKKFFKYGFLAIVSPFNKDGKYKIAKAL